jgi:hypothetical protein
LAARCFLLIVLLPGECFPGLNLAGEGAEFVLWVGWSCGYVVWFVGGGNIFDGCDSKLMAADGRRMKADNARTDATRTAMRVAQRDIMAV